MDADVEGGCERDVVEREPVALSIILSASSTCGVMPERIRPNKRRLWSSSVYDDPYEVVESWVEVEASQEALCRERSSRDMVEQRKEDNVNAVWT